MERRTRKSGNQAIALATVCILLIVTGFIFWNLNSDTAVPMDHQGRQGHTAEETKKQAPMPEEAQVTGTIEKPLEINYQDLEKNPELTAAINKRKQDLGISSALDLIVKSDETFTIGGKTVAMRDILEQAFLKNKGVFEEKIESSGAVKPQTTDEYGIYVVQPGDNIWNIHFRVIQEYYAGKGHKVSDQADEPLEDGSSSGVGRLLKFSETIVIIYNLESNSIDPDINIIKPLTKIVVYNLKEVFNLLEEINFENVDKIRFDGETIWIPANQPE